jgi:hypothetical protein
MRRRHLRIEGVGGEIHLCEDDFLCKYRSHDWWVTLDFWEYTLDFFFLLLMIQSFLFGKLLLTLHLGCLCNLDLEEEVLLNF